MSTEGLNIIELQYSEYIFNEACSEIAEDYLYIRFINDDFFMLRKYFINASFIYIHFDFFKLSIPLSSIIHSISTLWPENSNVLLIQSRLILNKLVLHLDFLLQSLLFIHYHPHRFRQVILQLHRHYLSPIYHLNE